jgi:PAS domain S-box-containing protein
MTSILTIRNKLFFSILLVLLISYSILFYTTVRGINATLEVRLQEELEENLTNARNQYFARADLLKQTLLFPAADAAVRDAVRGKDGAWLRNELNRWKGVTPSEDIMLFVDNDKRVLARRGSSAAGDLFSLNGMVDRAFAEKRPYIATELVENDQVRSGPARDSFVLPPGTGKVMVTAVVVPVFDGDGSLLGGIVAGDVINRSPHLTFSTSSVFGSSVEVSVNQGAYRIASNRPETFAGQLRYLPAVSGLLESGQTYRGEISIAGKAYEAAFFPLHDSGGRVIGSLSVELPRESYRSMQLGNLRNILASTAVGGILAFALAFVVSRRLTGPLRALADGAAKIADGDFSQRVEVAYRDEVGDLAASFNRMTEAIAERDRMIRKKNIDLMKLNRDLEVRVADRTARLQIEMDMQEKVLASMAEGIVVTDRDNRVVHFNPAAQKIFKINESRVIGQPIFQICELVGFCGVVQLVERVRAGEQPEGESLDIELSTRGKQLKIYVTAIHDEGGAVAGVVMSIRDVTIEGEIDRMKTEFISTISHELKTPLTSMKGSLQYIVQKGKWLTGAEREMLDVCLRNTDRLIRLINDILDISRIEAGQMSFRFRPQSIGELVVYSIEEIKALAMHNGISIVTNVVGGLPLVRGDHDRLVQVLGNLLSNAVKFSPRGKVVMVGAEQRGGYVAVSVTNGGPEIPWGDRDKLFRKFHQLSPHAKDLGGTGLGLAICKEIIERHHGEIFYSTGASGGNVFTFTVPVIEEKA